MRRRNHPHIHSYCLVITHPLQFATLQEPQHLCLQRHRHLSNLIEKQRSTMCRLDPTRARLHRPGKRSASMTKQFSFKQGLRNRRTIQHSKRFTCPLTQSMQRPCDDLFSRPSLSFNQYNRRTAVPPT